MPARQFQATALQARRKRALGRLSVMRGGQVCSRAERMGLAGARRLYLQSATRLSEILAEVVAMRPRAVVIDSIQTVYLDDVSGSAGSVSQARAWRRP